MSVSDQAQSIARSFGATIEDLGSMIQAELRLSQAEVSKKMEDVTRGILLVSGAAVLCIPVLVILLISAAIALTQAGLQPALAYLIAGLIGACVSVAFAFVGMRYLRADNLKPRVSLEEFRRGAQTVREVLR